MAVAFALLTAGLTVSCSDNDNAEEEELKANYVYIQRTDFVESDVKDFVIMHTPVGLDGEVRMDFSAKTGKPAASDIRVHLAIEGSEMFPASSYRIVDAEGNTLSDNTLVIKAGQTTSEQVSLVLDDISQLASYDDEHKEYGNIKITSIETNASNTRIATNARINTINFCVDKSKIVYFTLGSLPKDCKEIPQSSITLKADGTWIDTDCNNVLNNSNDNWLRFWGSWNCGLQIDLGEEKTLTGLKVTYWNDYYSAQHFTLRMWNGSSWEDVVNSDYSGVTQQVTLYGKPKARWFYYQISGFASRYMYMMQFHAYTE